MSEHSRGTLQDLTKQMKENKVPDKELLGMSYEATVNNEKITKNKNCFFITA